MALIYEYMARGHLGSHLSGIKILHILSIFPLLANILSSTIIIIAVIEGKSSHSMLTHLNIYNGKYSCASIPHHVMVRDNIVGLAL
eukprot:TRINITY_DN18040_c0_g1_i1.p1 TRINITY_DN18040_c0_g1~~TRINITY_DN18040_c0_g1_i1.p1  ORF type:complete len:100 (-),score=2.26 TRINITY_DN18040_c0_g1_i1:199-456(-)